MAHFTKWIAEGDGICTGYKANNSFVNILGGQVVATVGGGLTTWEGRASRIDSQWKTGAILTLLPGDDFLYYYDGWRFVNYCDRLIAYLDARKLKGYFTIMCSPLPRYLPQLPRSIDYESWRRRLIPILRTWAGSHCDAFCHLGGNFQIGPAIAAQSNLAYINGVYPTLACHQTIAFNVMKPLLISLGKW